MGIGIKSRYFRTTLAVEWNGKVRLGCTVSLTVSCEEKTAGLENCRYGKLLVGEMTVRQKRCSRDFKLARKAKASLRVFMRGMPLTFGMIKWNSVERKCKKC